MQITINNCRPKIGEEGGGGGGEKEKEKRKEEERKEKERLTRTHLIPPQWIRRKSSTARITSLSLASSKPTSIATSSHAQSNKVPPSPSSSLKILLIVGYPK